MLILCIICVYICALQLNKKQTIAMGKLQKTNTKILKKLGWKIISYKDSNIHIISKTIDSILIQISICGFPYVKIFSVHIYGRTLRWDLLTSPTILESEFRSNPLAWEKLIQEVPQIKNDLEKTKEYVRKYDLMIEKDGNITNIYHRNK